MVKKGYKIVYEIKSITGKLFCFYCNKQFIEADFEAEVNFESSN